MNYFKKAEVLLMSSPASMTGIFIMNILGFNFRLWRD